MHGQKTARSLRSHHLRTAIRGLVCVFLLLAVGSNITLAKPEHEGDGSGFAPTFLARPDGTGGPLVGYDTVTGRTRFTLPAGFLAANGSRYFAAVPDGAGTAIDVYEPQLGTLMVRVVIDGAWELRGVSATGAWLGLRRIPTEAELAGWRAGDDWRTDIAIMDAVTSRIAHETHLDGNFDVDAISARGDALFLVQHLPAVDPEHYLIRLYDLAAGVLQEGALRDKRNVDEVMTGYAWDGVASPDGHWLLTLYLNTQRDNAFVHTLDLVNRYPVCITLPSGDGDMAKLKAYTMTLANDGIHVYAANPVLGRLAVIDLTTRDVSRVVAFPAVTLHDDGEQPSAHSLLSPDGRMLYFTGGQVVWEYDIMAGTIGRSYLAPSAVVGLGLSLDGTRLLMADPIGTVTAVDLKSGEVSALAGA